MAKLISKKDAGIKTVVELTVEGGIYMSENGLIHHNCNECVRLHLMPDGVTPKVYKLSEVGFNYHKKGENNPKIAGLHPHCRCSLSFLAPNFGFKNGQVTYIGEGHDEYKKQRGG